MRCSRALLVLLLSQPLIPLAQVAVFTGESATGQADGVAVTEQRQPCAHYDPLRQPFFGDTHVHTALSFDASGQDTRNMPADAYHFARGGAMRIQPYDEQGVGQREIKLDRPLDFAAVTDHSEFLGEMRLCKTEGLPGYDHPVCYAHRNFPGLTQLMFGGMGLSLKYRWGLCGADNKDCMAAAADTWSLIRQAAEDAYDRSEDCQFTSFVGYEWTATVGRGSNLHHNVIFRNAQVPDRPMSWIETPAQVQLWDYLEFDCARDIPGCDGIAIPHNSNLSRGLIFESARLGSKEPPAEPVTAAEARRRAHFNPLIEVMQHKGSSECDNRLAAWSEDEFCDFEKLPYDTFGTKNTGEDGEGVIAVLKQIFGGSEFRNIQSPPETAYLRYALKKGLEQQARLGANSFQFGLIAATDTHVAAPGLVMESRHPGHGGAGMGSGEGLRAGLPDELEFNPGGLAVLWAEQNTRDALFAAMRRREAYATSGTRPTLRFFGGWDYDQDLCDNNELVARGYRDGVPMGGELPARPGQSTRPHFVIAATADPGTQSEPGSALQRLQLVKGWYADGKLHEKVLDVAGGANDASVDLDTCESTGSGHQRLCTIWQDDSFDPDAPAFYYTRLLENPSCRWSQRLCVDAGVRCEDPGSVPAGMQTCCAPEHQRVIQERAWSSPIWYTP